MYNDKLMGHDKKLWALVALIILPIMLAVFLPAIPQDLSYHDFADKTVVLGIPHFIDVLSNAIFFLVGMLGIKEVFIERQTNLYERWPLLLFFISVMLIGVGSSYYHLAPDNARLVFDRIPMVTASISLCCFMIAERLSKALGAFLLAPLLLIGVASVVHWYYSELQGYGDLRWYTCSLYLPMVAMVSLLFLFPSQKANDYLYAAFLLFAVARVCEMFDQSIHNLLFSIVSGHTLKHLLAGIACWLVIGYLKRRNHSKEFDFELDHIIL